MCARLTTSAGEDAPRTRSAHGPHLALTHPAIPSCYSVLALEPADQDALKSVHELTEKLKSMGVAVEPGPRRQSQVGDRASTLMRTATMLKSNRLSVSGHRLSIAAGGAPKDRQSVVAEGGGGSPAARRGSVAERTSVVAAGNAAGDQLQTTSL